MIKYICSNVSTSTYMAIDGDNQFLVLYIMKQGNLTGSFFSYVRINFITSLFKNGARYNNTMCVIDIVLIFVFAISSTTANAEARITKDNKLTKVCKNIYSQL